MESKSTTNRGILYISKLPYGFDDHAAYEFFS